MVESPIPQDILKYKGKFIANLSVRETVCGGLGVGMGIFSYLSWFTGVESEDIRMLLSALVILPFFLVGFLKLYDQPFEKIALTLLMENFIFPLKRKKEVRHPEFEKFENTRYWMLEERIAAPGEEETDKRKPSKKKKKPMAKIVIQKSETYKGIK